MPLRRISVTIPLMRGGPIPRSAPAGLLALLAAAAAATPAGAQSRYADLEVTGTITVTWRGDPARGCVAGGVCDVEGRTILPVDARGQLFAPRRRGRQQIFGYVFDERSSSLARVTRRGAGASGDPPPICVDAPPAGSFGPDGFGLTFSSQPSGRIQVSVRPTPALGAGRCAGPLPSDLEAALPRTEVAASRLLGGPAAVDLSGRRAFAAGPFSGEVASAVRVGVARVRTRRGATGRGRPVAPRPRRIVTRVRALAVDYRIRTVEGALTSSFSGLPAPDCQVLDACGITGATTVEPRSGGTFSLRAGGRRPVAAAGTLAGALRDVRAGRLRLRASYGRPTSGVVSGTARRDGAAAPCADRGGRGGLRLQSRQRAGALRLELIATQIFPAATVLRSRCPGPGISADAVLARGRVAVAALGTRTLTLRLRATGEDSAPGYAAAPRTGEVVLRLQRTRARVSTVRRVRVVR